VSLAPLPCLPASHGVAVSYRVEEPRGRRARTSGVSGQGHRSRCLGLGCGLGLRGNEWSSFSRDPKLASLDNCIKSSVIWELNFELFGARGIYNSAICSKNCNLYLLSHHVHLYGYCWNRPTSYKCTIVSHRATYRPAIRRDVLCFAAVKTSACGVLPLSSASSHSWIPLPTVAP